MAANDSLTKMDVRYNALGYDGKAALRKAVEEDSGFDLVTSPRLINIAQSLQQQTESEGAKELAVALAANGSLTKMDVRYNALGYDGKAALRKAVERRSGFDLVT